MLVFDTFPTEVTFFVDELLLWCGVEGVAVVKVDWIVVSEGVEGGGGAVPPFPMELDIVLSRGVDGNVSSNWKARSNARSTKENTVIYSQGSTQGFFYLMTMRKCI